MMVLVIKLHLSAYFVSIFVAGCDCFHHRDDCSCALSKKDIVSKYISLKCSFEHKKQPYSRLT